MTGDGPDYPQTRESRRIPLATELELEYEGIEGFVREVSANISLGGMFITTPSPRPVGSRFRFECRLRDDTPLIQGVGEVVWTRPLGGGAEEPAGMGIRFQALSPGSRKVIFAVVDDYIRAGGRPFDVEKPPAETPAEPPAEGPAPPPETVTSPPGSPLPAAAPRPEASASRAAPSPARAAAGPPPEEPSAERGVEDLLADIGQAFGSSQHAGGEAAPFPGISYAAAPPVPRYRRGILLGGLLVALAALLGYFWWQSLAGEGREPLRGSELGAPRPGEAATGTAGSEPGERRGTGSETPVEPAPEEVVPEPAEEAPSPLRAIEEITWEVHEGGTLVRVRADGAFGSGLFRVEHLGGDQPRGIVKIRGIVRPFPGTVSAVGTREVERIRTGYHPADGGGELHVVLDFAHPGARIEELETEGSTLELRVRVR